MLVLAPVWFNVFDLQAQCNVGKKEFKKISMMIMQVRCTPSPCTLLGAAARLLTPSFRPSFFACAAVGLLACAAFGMAWCTQGAGKDSEKKQKVAAVLAEPFVYMTIYQVHVLSLSLALCPGRCSHSLCALA